MGNEIQFVNFSSGMGYSSFGISNECFIIWVIISTWLRSLFLFELVITLIYAVYLDLQIIISSDSSYVILVSQ